MQRAWFFREPTLPTVSRKGTVTPSTALGRMLAPDPAVRTASAAAVLRDLAQLDGPKTMVLFSAGLVNEDPTLLDESFRPSDRIEGSVLTGTVIAIDNDEAVVDVGLKAEGRVPLKEFSTPGHPAEVQVGDQHRPPQMRRDAAVRPPPMDAPQIASVGARLAPDCA